MDAARALTIGPLGWVPAGADERELYLTHKLIAKKGGYDGLLDVFGKRGGFSKDKLQTGEEPRIAFFLERIEPLAHAWEDGRTSRTLSILRDTGQEFTGSEWKKTVKVALTTLLKLRQSGSVREVLNHVRNSRLFALTDDFDERLREGSKLAHISAADSDALEREAKEAAFFEGLFALPYHQIAAFAEFFNEHTPFGTKHGAKGAEFDTVFVVLDDKGARWSLYSFDKYLDGSDKAGNPERFRRTRNVFYMCCSRAKRNLAVVDLGARTAAKDHQVQELFRKENCHYL